MATPRLRSIASIVVLLAAALAIPPAEATAGSPICVRPSDDYPAGDYPSILLAGNIVVFAPRAADGAVTPLRMLDSDVDGELELFIGVSLPRNRQDDAAPARVAFRPLCAGRQPTSVTFRFSQGGFEATWTARSIDGSALDVATSAVSADVQEVTLEHPSGIFEIEIAGIRIAIEDLCWRCGETTSAQFRRGDSTLDGVLDIGDPVLVLAFLFLGGRPPACLDAADFDDSGELDIGDAIAELGYLFLGGRPPAGGLGCIEDPTRDPLDCAADGACGAN